MAIVTDQENNSTLGRAGQKAAGSASHRVVSTASSTAKFPRGGAAVASTSNNANIRIDHPSLQFKHHYQVYNFKEQDLQVHSQNSSAELLDCQRHTSLSVSRDLHLDCGPGAHQSPSQQSDSTMDYAWLEPRHDPIATDTNLAEIDFENFKNEDLAYAFSCGVSIFSAIDIQLPYIRYQR